MVARLDSEPSPVPSGAPELGADNEEVWTGVVGLSAEQLGSFQKAGVI